MVADRRKKENGNASGMPAILRCAIYTRKSTDEGLEQTFNTLDAQREAAEAYINSQRHEGWSPLQQKYDDGGYTGANMDRPALKRLLADVESGVVNCVVVYKVDRLTRSLLDFSRIIEILDKHGVTFVSVTQQFNTTNSLGRLTLHILLSFAQFEREMISERTRDKMSAARRKGKWVGGSPVLGYDVAPQGGSIIINPAEAKRVRAIFGLYLELGSLIPVVEELDRREWRMKAWTTRDGRQAGGKPIAKNNLYNMLTNIIYTGKVEYGGTVYEGEHERITDDDTWNRVQSVLSRNGRLGGRNIGNKHGALLKGLVRCGSCNVGMIHTYVKKKNKLYRYYVCVKAHQRGCPNWLAFLDMIMLGRQSLVEFLKRGLGSSLTGITSDKAMFILYGPGGDNGKSTMVEVMEMLLGNYARRTPVETFLKKREGSIPNDIARLRGARFVWAAENDRGVRLAESLIKEMTGGDRKRVAIGPRLSSGRRTHSRWDGRITSASTNRYFTAGRKARIISGVARAIRAIFGS